MAVARHTTSARKRFPEDVISDPTLYRVSGAVANSGRPPKRAPGRCPASPRNRGMKPGSMSRITTDEVRELALLARLHLSDREVASMTDNLGAILEYVDALRALDTSAIEPMTHAVPFDCPTRPDEVKPS